MAGILDLPQEVVEPILLALDPVDVARMAQVARCFHAVVYGPGSQRLWRELYFAEPLDDLRTCVSPLGRLVGDTDWRAHLQRAIHAKLAVARYTELDLDERVRVLRSLLYLATHVTPRLQPDSDDISDNHVWLVTFLKDTSLFDSDDIPGPAASDQEVQLYHQLHTLFGLGPRDRSDKARVQSRAYVYSIRNHTQETGYGPFMHDGSGRVNWRHVQAIHHVVSMHVTPAPVAVRFPVYQLSLPFSQPVVQPHDESPDAADWAGVGGFWRVSFCFIDHHDLLEYNRLDVPESEPLDASIFEDADFEEVFTTINMRCEVSRYEHDNDHPENPIIHFSGATEDQSRVHGSVRLTLENQIRYHFESGHDENFVWSSEGIQIGGVKSFYGVLGSWTTVQHGWGDPVGPFWLTKMLYPPPNGDAGF